MTNDLLIHSLLDEYENANADEIILEKPPMRVNQRGSVSSLLTVEYPPINHGVAKVAKLPVACQMMVTQPQILLTVQAKQVGECLRGTFGF